MGSVQTGFRSLYSRASVSRFGLFARTRFPHRNTAVNTVFKRSRLFRGLRSSCVGLLTLAALAITVSSCSALFPQRKVQEFRNAEVPGSQFRTIAVIAGDETSPGLRMSATMREELNKEGWKGVRRAGRWANENEAVAEICRVAGEEKVDGVLIVFYNQLVLRSCAVDTTAFRIVSSGGEMGLPQMAQRLYAYLRTGPPTATGTW